MTNVRPEVPAADRPVVDSTAGSVVAPAARPVVKLVGTPVVIDTQGRIWALEGGSAAVMAYVAIDPAPSRERLAALLWPDSDNARRNLRQQLLRLKNAVGGTVLVEGDSALRLADGVGLLDGDDVAAPLLGELRFPDSPEFDAWLEQQRKRRRERATATLQADIAQAEASGRYDDGLGLAQRLVALDPLSEAHHRLVMRMHYLRGDRAAGLAAYEQLARLLREQLGLEPDTATQALARSLRETGHAALTAPPRAPAGSVPATVLRPPRLVGRDDALGALRMALRAGRVALVLGEPGMGKSRLLADAAAVAGAGVVWVAGRPGDAGVPYATLARLLRRLSERHEPVFTSTQAAAIGCVLPEWAVTLAPAGPAADLRAALHGAVQAWLAQAQQQGLALVVFDDLHFADAASIEAMQALVFSDASSPLRFALAARPGEIGTEGEALRNALAETRALDEIALEPLTVEQTTELVASLGLPDLDAQTLGPQLARHSGGNPLYALETLKLGLADGSLREGRLPTPQGVGVLIERRLKQLAAPALALARVAAVAGVDFDIDLAEAVIGRTAVDLADAWSQLDAAQVLRDGAFAHDLVHDAVLRTIPKPIARRLHEQCATHLAARGGEPARLGAHWMAAGKVREGGEAYLEAAERAQRAGRSVEEAAFLAHAAHAFAAAGDEPRRFEVLTKRLKALNWADFGAEADRALEELQTLATDDRQRLRVMREQLQLMVTRGQFPQALEHGPKALSLARSLADTPEQVRINCMISGVLRQMGRASEGYDLLLPYARWVRESAPVELLVVWLGYWGSALSSMYRLREAVAVHEEYHALAATRGLLPIEVATNLNNLAVAHNMMGRTAQAVGASERAVQALQGDPRAKGAPTLNKLNLAYYLSEYAHYAEALALFDDVLPTVERRAGPTWTFAARNWLGAMWLRLGQHARAASLLALDDDSMPVGVRVPRLALRSQLLEATHQPGSRALIEQASAMAPGEGHLLTRLLESGIQPVEDMLRLAPRWIALAQGLERHGLVLRGWVVLARAASTLGDHAQAANAARRALALLADGIRPELMYHVEAWLIAADALRAAGHTDEADAAIGAGMQWLQGHAVPHVPPEFLDSFLNRNPHNCALLRAGRSMGATGAPSRRRRSVSRP